MGIFDFFKKKKEPVSKIPTEILNRWFDKMVDQLTSSEYKTMFTSNVLIKKGEKLVLDIPSVQYCEERTVKFKGSTQGFSVRLMKGVFL